MRAFDLELEFRMDKASGNRFIKVNAGWMHHPEQCAELIRIIRLGAKMLQRPGDDGQDDDA